MITFLLGLLLVWESLPAFGAPGAEAPNAKTPQAKFYVANFPPYAFLGPAGPSGFFVDAIKSMAPHANHTGTLGVVPWKRAQHELLKLKDGAPKLIFPLIRSPERESAYRWVAELFTDDIVLFFPKGKQPVTSLAAAAGLRIGVVGGSALLPEVQSVPGIVVDIASDMESCAKKLKAGRVDAWYSTRWVGVSTLKHLGMRADDVMISPSFRRMPIYLGASPETPDEVVAAWAKAFDIIKANGTYDKILKKWKTETGDG